MAAIALLFVEADDSYLTVLRLDDGEDLRIFGSDAAYADGQPPEAERLLQRLLQVSPHHMLKGYRTFAEAVRKARQAVEHWTDVIAKCERERV